jgi:predicted MFS family arabinose efflux permease
VPALIGDVWRGGERDRSAARATGANGLAWVLGLPALAAIAQLAGWRVACSAFGAIILSIVGVGAMVLPH